MQTGYYMKQCVWIQRQIYLNHTKKCILYTEEAEEYFNGNVYVPDDLEVIEL